VQKSRLIRLIGLLDVSLTRVTHKTVNATRGEGTYCNDLQNRTVSRIYSHKEILTRKLSPITRNVCCTLREEAAREVQND